MERSVSFVVAGEIATRITITEKDGQLLFFVEALDGEVSGDLRGIFFDLPGVDADSVGLSISQVDMDDGDKHNAKFGEASISSVGGDANIKGDVVNDQGAFDVGIGFGTSGIGKDDISTASFALSATGGLTLDDISLADFAVRYTSVGVEGDRNDSLKIGGMSIGIPKNDAFGILEDDGTASHDLFANDDGVSPDVRVIAAAVDGTPFASDLTWDFIYTNRDGTALDLGTVTLDENGVATFVGDGPDIDALYPGEEAKLVFSYTVSPDGGVSTATAFTTLTVTGQNDAPAYAGGDLQADMLEGDADPTLSDTGIIAFADIDLADAADEHSASAAYLGSSYGSQLVSLSAEVIAQTGMDGAGGQVQWTVTVDNADVEFLAEGETITETYEITISDKNGGTVTREVKVDIVGRNNRPDISVSTGDSDGALVFEHADLTARGTLTVTDVDIADTVLASVDGLEITGDNGGIDRSVLASLLSLSANSIVEAGETSDKLTWSFDPGSEGFTHLANGETLLLAYKLLVTDSVGATDTQTVEIMIEGTNTAPTIQDISIALAETNAPISESRLLPVEDADGDALAVTVEGVSVRGDYADLIPVADLRGYLDINYITLNNNFVAQFTSTPETFDFLGVGESLVIDYTVRATDPDGEFVDGLVSVTINGTNDPAILEPFRVLVPDFDTDLNPTFTYQPIGVRALISEGDEAFTATGFLRFGELDLSDTNAISIEPVRATWKSGDQETDYPAALAGIALVSGPLRGAYNGEDVITWSYASPEAFDFLRAGDELEIIYKIVAKDGNSTTEEEVTILVTGTNDRPTAVDDLHNIGEDLVGLAPGSKGVRLSAFLDNDLDPDSPNLEFAQHIAIQLPNGTIVETLPIRAKYGTISLETEDGVTSYYYKPAEHFSGIDVLEYRVIDGDGGYDVGQAQINVEAIPDEPVVDIDISAGGSPSVVIVTVTGSTHDTDGSESVEVIADFSEAPAGTGIALLTDTPALKTYAVTLADPDNGFEVTAMATTTEASNFRDRSATTTAEVLLQPVTAAGAGVISFSVSDINPYALGDSFDWDYRQFFGIDFERDFNKRDSEFNTYSIDGTVGAKAGIEPYFKLTNGTLDVDLAPAYVQVSAEYDPIDDTLEVLTPNFVGLPQVGSTFSVQSPQFKMGLDLIFGATVETKLKVLGEKILDVDFSQDRTVNLLDIDGDTLVDLGPFLSLATKPLSYSAKGTDVSFDPNNQIRAKAEVDNVASLSFDIDDFIFWLPSTPDNPFNDNMDIEAAGFKLDLILDYLDIDFNVGLDWNESFTLDPGEVKATLSLNGIQVDDDFDFARGETISNARSYADENGLIGAALDFYVDGATFSADPSLTIDLGPSVSIGTFGIKARAGGLVLVDASIGPLASAAKSFDVAEIDIDVEPMVDLLFPEQSIHFEIDIA